MKHSSMSPGFERAIASDGRIVLYGASSSGLRVLYNLLDKGIDPQRISFFDSDTKKQGTVLSGIGVLTAAEFESLGKEVLILISSSIHYEIEPLLQKKGYRNFVFDHDLVYNKRHYSKYDDRFGALLREISSSCNMDGDEQYTLYSSAKAVTEIDGSFAEVGVYKGGSAKILNGLKDRKKLHLFDTFSGLPAVERLEGENLRDGWLSDTSEEAVKRFLGELDNVFFHKGVFPATAAGVEDESFSLVHIDVDLYQTTFDCLQFFWPRLLSGGRLISHDYNNIGCPGVKQAFREYFADSQHLIVEVAESQCLVVKP